MEVRAAPGDLFEHPFLRGVLSGFLSVVVIAGCFSIAAITGSIAHPSAQLFRDLAQINAVLFVAFAVAIAGIGLRDGESVKGYLDWLGSGCGVALADVIAIGAGVALAAYREAQHQSTLDLLGLCWMGSTFVLTGLCVALLPYVAFGPAPAGKT